MFVRTEVALRPEFSDPEATSFLRKLEISHSELRRQIRWARWVNVYTIEIEATRERMIGAIQEILGDRVLKWLFTGGLIPSIAGPHGSVLDLMEQAPERPGVFWGLERRLRPGVTDPVARSLVEAFEIFLGERAVDAKASSGALLLLEGPKLTEEKLGIIAREAFCNDLIQSWMVFEETELLSQSRFKMPPKKKELPKGIRLATDRRAPIEEIPILKLSTTELEALSVKRLWALSNQELEAIKKEYSDPAVHMVRAKIGLTPDPTDVEMEVIAQSWSEHCKHKIFRARIRYEEADGARSPKQTKIPSEIDGLFSKTIKKTTEEIPRPWLLSVFSDNAGIIALDDQDAFCMKVETHNAPSALDPYGGALTGILGVNRDILGSGLGAKPIFNTDVFCVAPIGYLAGLPERVLHPRRILDGISSGVEAGGNPSGIPTVNGALVFEPRYLGRPLVFCGTGGILPRRVGERASEEKKILPGDRVIMAGGRIGKDGIHGATFSSLALDENSPATAVQLGDAITQKRLMDFLLEARDQGLYRALTDNGAGGLSSSVGELALLTGGAKIDVSLAKTKYPGLKPFELVISESQERMTFAVPPERRDAFLKLASSRGVECSDLGEFTKSGYFEILFEGKHIACISLSFLHEGVPTQEFSAKWEGRPQAPGVVVAHFEQEGPKRLLDLLARPNISSKEWLIRQYDHEVQGRSVIKPLHVAGLGTPSEKSGPNDGSVLQVRSDSPMGIAVGCGICPKLSDIDPYLMAQMAVDEAVRNLLAVGGEFGREESVLAILDNFCWPDPVKDPGKAAALVRACYGMREAALALQTPFISGKDSMKNDYRGKKDGQDITISIPPTLLITAVGRVPDFRNSKSSDFKFTGDTIYILGLHRPGLIGSELHRWCIERLNEKGGFESQVVLPVEDSQGRGVQTPAPHWELAVRTYSWLGEAIGKQRKHIRSVHDVSDGGLFVALSECMIARGMGARVFIPKEADAWEYAFGEGFHTFLVSVDGVNAAVVENEWSELGVPFRALGEVTGTGSLQVYRQESGGGARLSWGVATDLLHEAWSKKVVLE